MISHESSLEGLMLKLKLQYFGHLMERTDSFEKTLMLGKLKVGEWDDRGWDGWMASPTQWIWVWVSSGSWWWIGKPGILQSMWLQRVGHYWVTELTEVAFGQCVMCFSFIPQVIYWMLTANRHCARCYKGSLLKLNKCYKINKRKI